VKALISVAPLWPDGLARPVSWSLRWSMRSEGMYWPHPRFTPMTPTVPVLAPGNGKTKTARLWTYVRDDRPAGYRTAPAVWFAYSEDARENIRSGI
jgi:Transposase IS66 family